MAIDPVERLKRLFSRQTVLNMQEIVRKLRRSRASIFRDLTTLGYLSSYTHAHRYFTLPHIPDFDQDGLWHYQGIGFSQHGSLKMTLRHLVEQADDGRTHPELQRRLRVRVHNPLLDLMRRSEIGRERVGGIYLYVSAEMERAAMQIARRREGMEWRKALPTWDRNVVIAVLLEVIHSGDREPESVAARVQAGGMTINQDQVRAIFAHYGLVKIN